MGKVLKSVGGTHLRYNLFVQPDEPRVKDGLWIKAPVTKGFKDVVIKPNFFRANTIVNDSVSEFKKGNCVKITAAYSKVYKGKYIYYMVPEFYPTSGYCYPKVYRLNVFTDTSELVYTCPDKVSVSSDADSWHYTLEPYFINDVIYLAEGNGTNIILQKLYNMQNETVMYTDSATYTVLNLGFNFNSSGNCGHFALDYKENETLFFASDSYYSYVRMKSYNWDTKTVTERIPASKVPGGLDLTYIGINYLGWNSNGFHVYDDTLYIIPRPYQTDAKNCYTFNLLTDTLSIISNAVPWAVGSSTSILKTELIGAKIYCFYCSQSSSYLAGGTYNSSVYIYDIATGVFTYFGDLPSAFVVSLARYVPDHGIFMQCLGSSSGSISSSNAPYNKQLTFTSESQSENTLCLQNGSTYPMRVLNVEGLTKTLTKYTDNPIAQNEFHRDKDFSISDAWMYTNDFQYYPTYVGNGTAWTKVKN